MGRRSWSLGLEAVHAKGVSLAVHPWVSESTIGSLELAIPVLLEISFLYYDIAAVYRLVIVIFRLNEHISLLLEGVDNELGKIGIHVLDFLIEATFYVKLLLAILPCDYAHSQLLCYVFNGHLLAVFEGMQHRRFRETDLPFIVKHYILSLNLVIPSLL